MKKTLAEIAKAIDGALKGDPGKIIQYAASFEEAGPEGITFAGNKKYLKQIDATKAGAVIVPREFDTDSINIVKTDNPQVAFITVLELFNKPYSLKPGIDPGASIGDNFTHGSGLAVAPCAVVGNNVTVGDRVTFYPGVCIGDDVVIGDDVTIYPNAAVLERCRLGNRVIIHPGSIIGSDGYGFAVDGDQYIKIPQLGIVQIDDDVEIGTNCTIDRATFGRTWIQSGVKTDNMVHIAHNVVVGENTVMVAQSGLSGSVHVGKRCRIAGKAAVAGHLTVGDDVTIGSRAGVIKNVANGQIVSGFPEMPHTQWLKMSLVKRKLPELKKKIAELEERLDRIEKGKV